MKNYYYTDPSEQDAKQEAKWRMYGAPRENVIEQARKLAEQIKKPVVVGHEVITRSGTVKETGDTAICHPSGKIHFAGAR